MNGAPAEDPWKTRFPVHTDQDDLVSRREMLELAVYTSGALFAGTAGLAVLGRLPRGERPPEREVARGSAVRVGEPVYFRYPGPEDEAVLLRLLDGRLVAYSQVCTHLSCAVYYRARDACLHCPCHEGKFDPATGEPVAGPPRRPLPRIVLREEGDRVIAVARVP